VIFLDYSAAASESEVTISSATSSAATSATSSTFSAGAITKESELIPCGSAFAFFAFFFDSTATSAT
jgi:hypothetical protein